MRNRNDHLQDKNLKLEELALIFVIRVLKANIVNNIFFIRLILF